VIEWGPGQNSCGSGARNSTLGPGAPIGAGGGLGAASAPPDKAGFLPPAGRDLFGLRKDGTQFQVEVGLNPINTTNGLLILGQVVDISERKRAEVELRQYAEREQLFIAAVEWPQV
jgi:hypothetical protein